MQAYEQSGDSNEYALLFPGQGTQHIGMGEDVCELSARTRRVWDCASDIAGFDVRRLCFKGPMTALAKTHYQQVAVTVVNIATLEAMREQAGVSESAVAGHSVGEFSALYAAGVLGLEDCLRAVAARGQIMQALALETDGGMYAIKGIDRDTVTALIAEQGLGDLVGVANDNSPRQQVISGCRKGLKTLLPHIMRAGYEQVRLPVNGAWHSALMNDGRGDFQAVIDGLNFVPPALPLFTNQAAAPVSSIEQIKRDLVSNLSATVRWRETIDALVASGHRAFLEVGPKKVLGRLLLDFPHEGLSARHAADLLGAGQPAAEPA